MEKQNGNYPYEMKGGEGVSLMLPEDYVKNSIV